MNIEHTMKTKPLSCIHINLCELFFAEIPCQKASIPEHSNHVEALKKNKKVLIVHPIQDKRGGLPVIVILNSRTTKPKCDTCDGKKCLHVNIYREGAEKGKDVEINILDDLPAKKLTAKKQKSNNYLDPSD